jgi:hypothetical protein
MPIAKLQLRLPEELHAELTAQAQANGRSLNSELIDRLNASLEATVEIGSPEVNALAHLFAGAFMWAGRAAALSRGHPEWRPLDWMQDRTCFGLALVTAIDAIRDFTMPNLHLPPQVTTQTPLTVAEVDRYLERMRSVDAEAAA